MHEAPMPIRLRRTLLLLWVAIVFDVFMLFSICVVTWGLWCLSWTLGPFILLVNVGALGHTLTSPPSERSLLLLRVAAALQVCMILNCDVITPAMGAALLVLLNHPDIATWARGEWVAPALPEPASGSRTLQLALEHSPIAFGMGVYQVGVSLDGETHYVDWGEHELEVPDEGGHLRLFVPMPLGQAFSMERKLELADVSLVYEVPPLIFMDAKLSPPAQSGDSRPTEG